MSRSAPRVVLPVAILTAACAALRLPGLTALPIFGDEAIFLRCARLVRESPAQYLWISLSERTPPLHTWLLALVLPLFEDPVRAGRLLSVLAAALTVPALYALCRALDRGLPRRAALFACALYAASPLFCLHQRMARVEALFVLEMTVAAWLAVRLAAHAREGGRILPLALAFGFVMGLTMLTRQAVSYLLWALPVIAFLFARASTREPRRGGGLLAAALGASAALALALWLPMLTTRAGPDLATRVLPLEAVHETASTEGWALLTGKNAADSVAWLWLYLTPPVAILAAGALVSLALSGRGRLAGFLAAWSCLVLAPALPLANAFFPRYLVPAGVPLLIAAGFALAELAQKTGRLAAAALVAALFAWPAHDVYGQLSDWKSQKLASVDRWQFVSGWPAGFATERAVAYLLEMGLRAPTFVVTSLDSGNAADTLWLRLDGKPGVRLGAARGLDLPLALADPLENAVVVLSGDPRRGEAAGSVRVPPGVPLLFVSREKIYTYEGLVRAEDHWRRFHPALHEVARFENPPYPDGRPGDAVVILAIR